MMDVHPIESFAELGNVIPLLLWESRRCCWIVTVKVKMFNQWLAKTISTRPDILAQISFKISWLPEIQIY